MSILISLVIFVAGFVVGALVTRKNVDEVNAVVAEAKELAAKIDAKVDELKDEKKPATKRGRKPTAKK